VNVWTYFIVEQPRVEYFHALITHQANMVRKFCPGAKHIVVDGHDGVDMYARACAMHEFVLSPGFDSPTVFLDNDAFPNRDLSTAFDEVNHVGLTLRGTPGLMPINEGVIFARPTDEARGFFAAYLDTFCGLQHVMHAERWKWWGGQTSLNMLAGPAADRITLLPCDTWNYSPDEPQPRAVLDSKAVLHLKGPRKQLFDQLVAYQESR
jgi:hypothetical protein